MDQFDWFSPQPFDVAAELQRPFDSLNTWAPAGIPNAGVGFPGIGGGSGTSPWSMNGIFGKNGWGMPALQVGTGLLDSFMGLKQYGLAKDALKQQRNQFDKNFAAQQKTTNAALSDRQRARVASNPGAYQSEADYMARWGV